MEGRVIMTNILQVERSADVVTQAGTIHASWLASMHMPPMRGICPDVPVHSQVP